MGVKFSILKCGKYNDIFCCKMWHCKSYSLFCSKNINVFENALATTVNAFVINKLIKLTMLWITGPWLTSYMAADICEGIQILLFLFLHGNLWICIRSISLAYDIQHTKRALMHFADNVGPDHCAHLCSLIWTFFVPRHTTVSTDSVRGKRRPRSACTIRCRLIRACVIRNYITALLWDVHHMFLLENMKISILFDCKKSLALSYVLYSVSIREQTEPKQYFSSLGLTIFKPLTCWIN